MVFTGNLCEKRKHLFGEHHGFLNVGVLKLKIPSFHPANNTFRFKGMFQCRGGFWYKGMNQVTIAVVQVGFFFQSFYPFVRLLSILHYL